MTECHAEQAYPLNDVQQQRLALEDLLGDGPAPSWLIAGAIVTGVTDLARFHEVLLELPRVYPVLRTTLVTDGPTESWYQQIRSCAEIRRGRVPVVHVPGVISWSDLTDAMLEDLQTRNPDYRFAVSYGIDEDGALRVVFYFDHMVFDVRSMDLIMAHVAKSAASEAVVADLGSCRCGANEFADFVKRAADPADGGQLPERYKWALDLMLAAGSPHGYASLPLAKPMSVRTERGADHNVARFSIPSGRKLSYTPFAAFASALALSLETEFGSPAMLYTPTLNREASEMRAVGWFSGTPIMPVRTTQLLAAVAEDQALDGAQATSEGMAAAAQAMQHGQPLTNLVYQKVGAVLGDRMPFMDCLPDSRPYIIIGYADRVRQRMEWKAGDIVVRRVPLTGVSFPPTAVPPGYIFLRLARETPDEWSIESLHEIGRYEDGAMATLLASTEQYLRQLLG